MGLSFIVLPKHKEYVWVEMGDGEDGSATLGSHTAFTIVIIQHVVHLTAVHVHME